MNKYRQKLMNSSVYTYSGCCYAASRNESGRSMVEMLGVLAVIGVLSVSGIAGYNIAMNKHHANEIVNEASKRAVVVATQKMQGRSGSALSISEFGDERYGVKDEGLAGYFAITVKNVDKAVCQNILSSVGEKTQLRYVALSNTPTAKISACSDGPTEYALVYSDNLDENSESPIPCTNGKVKCTGGFYYVCENSKWSKKQALESWEYCDGDNIVEITDEWDTAGCRGGLYLKASGGTLDDALRWANESSDLGWYLKDLPDGKVCDGDQLVDGQKRCVNGQPQFSTDGEEWQPYTFGHCEYCNGDEVVGWTDNGDYYSYIQGCHNGIYQFCSQGSWEDNNYYDDPTRAALSLPSGKVCIDSWLTDAEKRCVNGQAQYRLSGGEEWQPYTLRHCEYCNGDEVVGYSYGDYYDFKGCHNGIYQFCSSSWEEDNYDDPAQPTPSGKTCIGSWLTDVEKRCVNGQAQYRLSGGEWQSYTLGKCEYCNGDEVDGIPNGGYSMIGCHNSVWQECSYSWEPANTEYDPMPQGKVCIGNWLTYGETRCLNGQPQQKIGNGDWENTTLTESGYCNGDKIDAANSYNPGCHDGQYMRYEYGRWIGEAVPPDGKVCVGNWLTDGGTRCVNGQPQQKIGNGDWTNISFSNCLYCNGDALASAAGYGYGCSAGVYKRCSDSSWYSNASSLPSGKVCVGNWLTDGETRCLNGQPQQRVVNGEWTNITLSGCQFCDGNTIAEANYSNKFGCHDGAYKNCTSGYWYSVKTLPSGKTCSGNWLKNI